jgi:hypothetical protein
LSADKTAAFLKIEDSPRVRLTSMVSATPHLKLGTEFHKIDNAADALDSFFVKITSPAPSTTGDAAGGTAQADYLKIDAALNVTSTDH